MPDDYEYLSEANLDRMSSIKSGALKSQYSAPASAKPISISKPVSENNWTPNKPKSNHYKSRPSIQNDFFANENVD